MSEYTVDPTDPLPKYYQVYVSLRARIHAGEFAPGDALPAERQLAADYGVSRITIIKAKDLLARDNLIIHQQGRGSFVLDQRELGYGSEPCRVAFCLPTFADAYVADILLGAARVAMHEEVQLEIVGVEAGDGEATRVRKAIDSGVDGVLLLPRAHHPDWALYEQLCRDAFPLVFLDRYYPALDVDRVVFDDDEAGYALAKSLIEIGHRRIGIITGAEADASSVRGRIRGYRRALEEAGLPYDEDLVCLDVYPDLVPSSLFNLPSSDLRLMEWLRRDLATAIIAVNRYVALQMSMDLRRINAQMMRVVIDGDDRTGRGQLDIVTAAVSDRPFDHFETSLAAVAIQSGERLGEKAMQVLLRRLRQGSELLPQHAILPMSIVGAPFSEGELVQPLSGRTVGG